MKILASILFLTFSLFAKDITISKDPMNIPIQKEKLNILNMPFEVNMQNIRILGNQKDFVGNSKGNSLYFTIYSYPMDLVIFGGSTPIYLSLQKAENVSDSDLIYNFFYSKEVPNKDYNLSPVDLEIKNIFKKINRENNLELTDFYAEKLNEKMVFNTEQLIGLKNMRYENQSFTIERVLLTNTSTEFINLRNFTEFKKIPNMVAYTFSNLILHPNESVVAFFVYDNSKEL